MSNQNASRPIIVYGLPQVVDGLKAAGFTVVTGSNFMETGMAAKKVFDEIGPTYLVIGDDHLPGLQQWADRAISQGCRTVHVLMPGTPARLNLPQAAQLQAPLTAADLLSAFGLQGAPAPRPEAPAAPPEAPAAPPEASNPAPQQNTGWGAPAASAPSQPAVQGWGAPTPDQAQSLDDVANTGIEAAREPFNEQPEPQWGEIRPQSVSDIPTMPTVFEPEQSSADDFFAPPRASESVPQDEQWPGMTSGSSGFSDWNSNNAVENEPQPANDFAANSWDAPQATNSQDQWNDFNTGVPSQSNLSNDTFATQQDGTADTWPEPASQQNPTSSAGSTDSWNTQPAAEQSWNMPAPESWDQQSSQQAETPAPWNESANSFNQPAETFGQPAESDWNQQAAPDWGQPAENFGQPVDQEWGQPAQESFGQQADANWDQPNQGFDQPSGSFGQPSEQSWNQPAQGFEQPAPQPWDQQSYSEPQQEQWTPQPFDAAPSPSDWNTAAPAPAPVAPVVSATPLRTTNAQGYVAPTGPKVGKAIFIIGGKGGIGKSTLSLQIANTLANAGYKTALIDGNVGQPDLTAYLRIINGKHQGTELPSIYQAATHGERAAVISPDVLNSVRSGYEPVKFGFVAGAPPHLNDANIVTEDVYARVIAKCQEEMSFVVVDLQIIEQANRSSFVENLVIPALKQGGYGLALTDMSGAGVNNLRYVLARLKDENMEMSRISAVINRVENDQMPVAEMIKSQFEPLKVSTSGIIAANKELSAITNSGMLDLGDTQITNVVRRFCRDTLNLPASQFPEIEGGTKSSADQKSRSSKGGGLFKIFRSK